MTRRIAAKTVRQTEGLGRWGGGLLILVFALSWLGALVFTAPLSLVRVSADTLPPGVTLTSQSGTVWAGVWRWSLPQAVVLTMDTRFQPAALWRGRLSWRVRVQGGGLQAEADVTPGWTGISVDRLRAKWTGGSALMQLATPWPLGGQFDAAGRIDFRRMGQGTVPEAGTLTVRWIDAELTTTEPLALGDLSLSATLNHGRLDGTVTPQVSASAPLQGQLVLRGPILAPSSIRVTGLLDVTPRASTALRQQLGLLGQRDSQGRIPIDGYLPER